MMLPFLRTAAVCGVVLVLAGPAAADPLFSLDTEAEFQAAIDDGRMRPMAESQWNDPDPGMAAFRANIGGTATYVEPDVYASGPTIYDNGDEIINLEAGMGMAWLDSGTPLAAGEYAAGWEYVFPVDPNLLGTKLWVDALPPAISPANGVVINTLGIGLVDAAGRVRSWTYNCVNLPPGPGTLQRNVPNWMEIAVTAFPGAATDAWHGLAPPPGPFPFDAAAYAETPGFDPTQVISIIGIENGIVPQGGTIVAPAPGQANRAIWNWWGVVAVQAVPEPSVVVMLLSLAGMGSLGYLWRRRRVG